MKCTYRSSNHWHSHLTFRGGKVSTHRQGLAQLTVGEEHITILGLIENTPTSATSNFRPEGQHITTVDSDILVDGDFLIVDPSAMQGATITDVDTLQ